MMSALTSGDSAGGGVAGPLCADGGVAGVLCAGAGVAGALCAGGGVAGPLCADAARGRPALTASTRNAARMLRSSLGISTLPIAFWRPRRGTQSPVRRPDILGYSRRGYKPVFARSMPELPEVETTRRGVAPHVERQKVTAVRIYDRRLRWPVPPDLPRWLVGRTVDRVDRRSKYLLFRLGADTLIVHMGMTGSLRVFIEPPPKQRHDHVELEFANGVVLRYRDPRRFGAMLWSPGSSALHPLLAKLGVEPFSDRFDGDYLYRATRHRRVAIKLALMDSHLVVGVGNIYANEALFRAGIRPRRAAKRVSRPQLARLVDA